jgi:tetratricopeptide (TPR) repeat protein
MNEVARLMESGVSEKRRGNFRGAIQLYKRAIEVSPAPNAIMYISLAKSQYLIKDRSGAIENYMRGFYHQLIEHKNEIDINSLHNVDYQLHILKSFYNVMIHLAHAYIDLSEEERVKFAMELKLSFDKQNEVFPEVDELLQIFKYTADIYAYDLASGGIDNMPTENLCFQKNKDIDWVNIYLTKGINVVYSMINWDSIIHLLTYAE